MTQTISTISRQEEQEMLRTQTGGNGNGGRSIPTVTITGPDDNEPQTAVVAAEAFLTQQRIVYLLNVTDNCNVLFTPLREQRGNATLANFEDGGAM